MDDHTYRGVPVARMATADILETLADGGAEHNGSGAELTSDEWYWLRLRLEIELLIREKGMRPS